MRQLVQSVRSGELRIIEGPDPIIGPAEVLVQTACSVVSAGTERAVRELASASLLQKARARPDLVRQVVRRARDSGLRSTIQTVRARLDEEMPLGYSAAGTVLEVGEAVANVRPGMRVATGSAGHGDLQVVPGLLAVPIPDGVTDEQAAFATVASIALHGFRLADVGPGGTVCVVGLGLIGQLTVRLAQAAGARAFGVDLREWTVLRARGAGAEAAVEAGQETTDQIGAWSRHHGADAVIVTAATPSSEPIQLAANRVRDRGTLVVVGDVGLELQRAPLYEKEVTLRVARSYGPGRYERSYESWGVDYPVGHVRFTEGRNLMAVLDLVACGRLAVDDLVTHRFDFSDAADAYQLLAQRDAGYLGIQLRFPPSRPVRRSRGTSTRQAPSGRKIALIGAGQFARTVLVPAIEEAALGRIVSVSSASGVTAGQMAERLGAESVPVDEAIEGSRADIVVIATSHNSHAELTSRALKAGKHVFCEKPLATTEAEFHEIEAIWEASGCHLAIGFNRRHSRDVRRVVTALGMRSDPLCIAYRVSAGRLPTPHWYSDRTAGGRLIGEACHFIDTCNAIVGRPSRLVGAIGSISSELLLADDVAISLAYADGSLATITYASGGASRTPKERIEVLGAGHTFVLDDFRLYTMDARSSRGPQDKGHVTQLREFARQIEIGASTAPTNASLASMSATFAALKSLQSQAFVAIDDRPDEYA